jgi:hypothetical protein
MNSKFTRHSKFKCIGLVVVVTLITSLMGCRQTNNTENLDEGGITSGGCFATGISTQSGLLLQEYWYNGEPHYLLYNEKDDSIEVNLHGARLIDTSSNSSHLGVDIGPRLAAPWVISPKGFMQVSIGSLPVPSPLPTFYLFSFLPDFGVLDPPSLTDDSRFDVSTFSTSGSLNGMLWAARRHSWFEFPSMSMPAGGVMNVSLKVTGEFSWVSLPKIAAPYPYTVPGLEVESANSANLRREETAENYRFYRDGLSSSQVFTIQLSIRAPVVVNPTIAVMDSFMCLKEIAGSCVEAAGRLAPGILIVP